MTTILRRLAKTTYIVVQTGCLVYCTWKYLGGFAICSGRSMEPTLHSSDVILINSTSVNWNNITKGDVVILRSPSNASEKLCKRVLRLEGEILKDPPASYSFGYVPKGSVWIEGDNKENSKDSRDYGPVPIGLITNKVSYKIWPLTGFGKVK